MKARQSLLTMLTAGSLMFAGTLLAQSQPMPPPPPPPAPAAPMPPAPAAPMPPAPPMPPATAGNLHGSAQLNTTQGQVTINSVMPPIVAGPAPSFEQLSGGASYITEDQAVAYPLLANDFIYVDKGHTGRINKQQYERWLANK